MLKIWHPLQQPGTTNKLSKGPRSGYYRSNEGTSCLPFLNFKKKKPHKWKNMGQVFKRARHVACLNYTYMQAHANASFPWSFARTASTFSSNASLNTTGHARAASPASRKSEHGHAGGNRGSTCIPLQHKRGQNDDKSEKSPTEGTDQGAETLQSWGGSARRSAGGSLIPSCFYT